MTEAKYWVGFSLVPGIGRVRLERLLQYFGDLEPAWQASHSHLKAAGLDEKSAHALIAQRVKIDLDAELAKLDRSGVRVLIKDSADFPRQLREIYDVPPVLYIRGTLLPEDRLSLAVVGTRRATAYGREVTQALTADLARNKVTIISGLARGIDSIAHNAALAAGGRTIAVCACGLDIVYPAENRELAQVIAGNGALVSEYPLGTKPRAENFPQRNRIMSGLSLGVLVVESMEKGGALITANFALQQDREVFAVPGSIFSTASKGPNALIRAGAKPVLEVNDILEEFSLGMLPQQMEFADLKLPGPADETEAVLLKHLSSGALHIDELCREAGLPVSTVSSTLTMMELKGIVRHLGNMQYTSTPGVRTN